MLLIKLVRSPIGHTSHQRKVIRALGLNKMNQTVTQPDNPSVRGMIRRVEHLVTVASAEGAPTKKSPKAKTARSTPKTAKRAGDVQTQSSVVPVEDGETKETPKPKVSAKGGAKPAKPRAASPKPKAKSTKE
jgi:large subunit ribosomal protein L30